MPQALTIAVACILCIAIHASIMTMIVRVAQTMGYRAVVHPSLRLIGTMVATVAILMVAHVLEVVVWAQTYKLVHASPDGADIFYFAFVNYTTLGYGDVVPVPRWRLLGPATAMCGVLMFGWSTAVIFEVLRKVLAYEASPSARDSGDSG